MKDSSLHAIEQLSAWFRSNCDGDWEHRHGIQIGTLDNPGWYLRVALEGTPMAGAALPRRIVERTEDDWISLEVKDGMFLAFGGPGNLLEMIRAFIDASNA